MPTLVELRALVKAKNARLEKGHKFNAFGKSKTAIEQFLGISSSAPASKAKAKAKSTGKRFATSKTSRAVAVAIAKKTGGDAKTIHESLKKKLQAAITKKRAQMKKAGREVTPKDLRAAAILAIKQSTREALKGKVASEEKSKRTGGKVEKKPISVAQKAVSKTQEAKKPRTLQELDKDTQAWAAERGYYVMNVHDHSHLIVHQMTGVNSQEMVKPADPNSIGPDPLEEALVFPLVGLANGAPPDKFKAACFKMLERYARVLEEDNPYYKNPDNYRDRFNGYVDRIINHPHREEYMKQVRELDEMGTKAFEALRAR